MIELIYKSNYKKQYKLILKIVSIFFMQNNGIKQNLRSQNLISIINFQKETSILTTTNDVLHNAMFYITSTFLNSSSKHYHAQQNS